nr:hypothetical protein [uncultured Flavobacterium sp.]
MEIGQIMQVEKYNQLSAKQWESDYEKAMEECKKGNRPLGSLPQLAMYLFYNKQGNVRKRGYVARTEKNTFICRSTKRQCIAELNK